jgi:hypothetical protein
MKKVYIYKMHAGQVGTDESFCIVDDDPLPSSTEWDCATEHAASYGNERDEDGEWGEDFSDPECWLEAVVTTLDELEKESGYLICGHDTFEALVKRLEEDGMVWQ